MARPRTGQTPPISFRPPPQLLADFDATIEAGRSRSDVLIELMHDRVTKMQRLGTALRTTGESARRATTAIQAFADKIPQENQ
jgi:hypothetical protein